MSHFLCRLTRVMKPTGGAAVHDLLTAFRMRDTERMLQHFAPGDDVLHISDTLIMRIDTLAPAVRDLWAETSAFEGAAEAIAVKVLAPDIAVA